MTDEQISNHLYNACNVVYLNDEYGTLTYVYQFCLKDEHGNELKVFVPDDYIDNFLRDYPDAY